MYLHKCILIGKLQEPTRNTNDYGLASEIMFHRTVRMRWKFFNFTLKLINNYPAFESALFPLYGLRRT